jgi:hypothetical protein
MSKTVTTVILEHACLLYASQLKPTRDEALDKAYFEYCKSDIYDQVIKQFSAPLQNYSIFQYMEFISRYQLKY